MRTSIRKPAKPGPLSCAWSSTCNNCTLWWTWTCSIDRLLCGICLHCCELRGYVGFWYINRETTGTSSSLATSTVRMLGKSTLWHHLQQQHLRTDRIQHRLSKFYEDLPSWVYLQGIPPLHSKLVGIYVHKQGRRVLHYVPVLYCPVCLPGYSNNAITLCLEASNWWSV